MGPSWWIDERKEEKKCCRGRARELIGVNWLLLFWPEAEKRDKSQDKRKKVCVLQGCNYKERRATRRRSERISFGLTKGRPEVRREKNKERWQVHTHCATHIFHTCWTAACFTHNYKHESLPTVWRPNAERIERNDGERKRWKKCVTCSSKKEGESVGKEVEREGGWRGGGAEANVLQVP